MAERSSVRVSFADRWIFTNGREAAVFLTLGPSFGGASAASEQAFENLAGIALLWQRCGRRAPVRGSCSASVSAVAGSDQDGMYSVRFRDGSRRSVRSSARQNGLRTPQRRRACVAWGERR